MALVSSEVQMHLAMALKDGLFKKTFGSFGGFCLKTQEVCHQSDFFCPTKTLLAAKPQSVYDEARRTGNMFEKQRMTDVFRVPFVVPAPKACSPARCGAFLRVGLFGGAQEGWDKKNSLGG